MTRVGKPFPFWLICVLILLCFPIVGGLGSSLLVREWKGGRRWKELPPPAGEKVVVLLDATITSLKKHRLCVRTERGAIYLWRKSYRSWGRLDPDGPRPDQYWHLLKPLTDREVIRYLIVSGFDADRQEPLLVVKSGNSKTYVWQNENWHPFENERVFGFQWPDDETKSGSIILTNNILNTSYTPASKDGWKPHRGFHSWFTLPKPSGKVIDEVKVAFEGSLSDWVSSYVLLEDGRLLVLAAETDFIDGVIWLAGLATAFFVGVALLIVLGIRRKSSNARGLEAVTF